MSKRTSLLIAGALLLGGAGFLLHLHFRASSPSGVGDREIETGLRGEHDQLAAQKLFEELANRPDALGLLQRTYAGTTDGAVRERTLQWGARLGSPDAVKWVADVASTDKQLAAQASAALGTVTSPFAVPSLARLALGDGSILVRSNAIRALGNSGGPAQASDLGNLVADDKQPLRVRQEAALSLAHIGNAAVVPRLEAALAGALSDGSSDGEQLRISIIRALGGITAPEARKALEDHRGRTLSDTERLFTDRALHPKG